MTRADNTISVFLQFRAMTYPVAVRVPESALPLLQDWAERAASADGRIIYGQPADRLRVPDPATIRVLGVKC